MLHVASHGAVIRLAPYPDNVVVCKCPTNSPSKSILCFCSVGIMIGCLGLCLKLNVILLLQTVILIQRSCPKLPTPFCVPYPNAFNARLLREIGVANSVVVQILCRQMKYSHQEYTSSAVVVMVWRMRCHSMVLAINGIFEPAQLYPPRPKFTGWLGAL